MKVTHEPPLKGLSILCIDNHIDSLEVLRLTLQLEGAQVVTATSADGAIFALKKSPIDVVISDLLMPEENGIEVLRKIRAAGYFGPAIALTGVREDIVQLGALRLGFSAYLRKPVEAEHLVATIQKTASLRTVA